VIDWFFNSELEKYSDVLKWKKSIKQTQCSKRTNYEKT